MSGKRLIVTADDLGLSEEVSEGIFASHSEGIVTAASLLVNAPDTERAVLRCRDYPDLEVGLHLSVVEGFALAPDGPSLRDELEYFPGPCLHRDWRRFLGRFLTGRIDLGELRRELEAQIVRFLGYFERIPFANATQHLHLLPGVRAIFLELSEKYQIRAVRAGGVVQRHLSGRRGMLSLAFDHLGRAVQRRARQRGIHCPDFTLGFDTSGQLSAAALHSSIAELAAVPRSRGTAEIVAHPGRECAALRQSLPRSYGPFSWEMELAALCAAETQEALRGAGVTLIRFADL